MNDLYGILTISIYVVQPSQSEHSRPRGREHTIFRTTCRQEEAQPLVQNFKRENPSLPLHRAFFEPMREELSLDEPVEPQFTNAVNF